MFEWETGLILWFQDHLEFLDGFWKVVTATGFGPFYMAAAAMIIWCVNARNGMRLAVFVTLCGGVNAVLKLVFAHPRPFWVDSRVRAPWKSGGFGMPSGHAQASAAWVVLARYARNPWWWVPALAAMVLVGTSRIALGVHFPLQVLAGWGIGLALALGFFVLEPRVARKFQDKSLGSQILASFFACAALVLAGVLVWVLQSDTYAQAQNLGGTAHMPKNFKAAALRNLGFVVVDAVVLFGFLAGGLWWSKQGGHSAGGPWRQRAARLAIGVMGLLILAALPQVIPIHRGSGLYWAVHTIQGGLTGLFISAGAPWVFVRLRLAQRAARQT